MPEISRFFGIVIAMYYKDHGPPHFHAKYSGQTSVFSLQELKLIEGQLPRGPVFVVGMSTSTSGRTDRQLGKGGIEEASPRDFTAEIGDSYAFR